MIEDTLVHFKTKTAFNTELEAGNIQQTSIVFIDDSKEIWTHGEFYDGSKIDLSSFITKDELTEALSTKQNTISDIDTIRTNAALGATAVQPAAISDMETKTNAAATYATKDELSGVGGLGLTPFDTLRSVSDIRTALSSGNFIADQYSGSQKRFIPYFVSSPNSSTAYAMYIEPQYNIIYKYTVNSDGFQQQLVGTLITSDNTVSSIVSLTQAEYDALTTKDAKTLYIITDE